jgi:hypothetical protein
MTREVSPRQYRNERSFRREVERRFGDKVPDEIWDDVGASRWRDAESEWGYAVESAVTSLLTALRHRRRKGQLRPLPTMIQRESKDPLTWRLRSVLLSRLVQDQVTEWRSRFLPRLIEVHSFDFTSGGGIVAGGRTGCLRPEEFRLWMEHLVKTDGGYLFGRPRANGAPEILLPLNCRILLSFPSSIAPRFLEPSDPPDLWWSGTDLGADDEIAVVAVQGGEISQLVLNYWGQKTLSSLADQANRIRHNKWSLAETAGLFLFGAVPMLSPMSARLSRTWDQLGSATRVDLSIDSRVHPEEVALFFRDLVAGQEIRANPTRQLRGFSVKVSTLLEYVLLRWHPERGADWRALWRDWQTGHGSTPGWGYSSSKTMSRVAQRALDKLGSELAPDLPRPQSDR